MVEKEAINQRTNEVDLKGEARAEEFFGSVEITVGFLFVATAAFFEFEGKRDLAVLAAAGLAGAVGAFEATRGHYENRKTQRADQVEAPSPINP